MNRRRTLPAPPLWRDTAGRADSAMPTWAWRWRPRIQAGGLWLTWCTPLALSGVEAAGYELLTGCNSAESHCFLKVCGGISCRNAPRTGRRADRSQVGRRSRHPPEANPKPLELRNIRKSNEHTQIGCKTGVAAEKILFFAIIRAASHVFIEFVAIKK